MNQLADEGAAARIAYAFAHRRYEPRHSDPLYLRYVAVPPPGCAARLIARTVTWRTPGWDWFVAGTLLGLGFSVMAFRACMATLLPPRPIISADLEPISH
jgi:hypothetical protein